MKVLWFTTSPSLGRNHLGYNNIGCSWIQSLEGEVTRTQNSFQLGIAFSWNDSNCEPFQSNNTFYYPIPNDSIKGKLRKLHSRWAHKATLNENIGKYIRIIEEFKPDIIHIFGSENDYGMVISKTTIPCIIHIQGNLIVYGGKWYSGLTLIDVVRYSNKWLLFKGHGLFHDFFTNKKMAEREREIFLKCQYFMGRTDWDKRLTSVLSPNSKYFHCDEILREMFYTHQWEHSLKMGEIIIVTTIRNNIYKGLETIYECKKILSQSHSQYKITWQIAGIGKDDEISYLVERKYKDTLVKHDIILLGPLQELELINILLGANIFVHPSHIDNSPNSVCEAMILGLPVIASYAGGTPSLIKDKVEGLLIQDGDPYALAGAIIELIQDYTWAKKLGKNARLVAHKRHDKEKIVNTVISTYRDVFNSKNENIDNN